MPIVIAGGSPLMGKLAARIGPRWPLTIGPLIVAGGFLLGLRIDAGSDYWTTVLPSILVISAGMAIAVAPLTTAVLGSVDAQPYRHRLRPQQRRLAQRRPDRDRPARHGAGAAGRGPDRRLSRRDDGRRGLALAAGLCAFLTLGDPGATTKSSQDDAVPAGAPDKA